MLTNPVVVIVKTGCGTDGDLVSNHNKQLSLVRRVTVTRARGAEVIGV